MLSLWDAVAVCAVCALLAVVAWPDPNKAQQVQAVAANCQASGMVARLHANGAIDCEKAEVSK